MRIMLGLAAGLLFGGAAQAVTFTSVPGAPDPGIPAGHMLVVDFDNPNAAGYTWSGGIATALGTSPAAATPAGNTTVYGFVSSARTPNNATLSTPNLKAISFSWGSIDTYNRVDVLGAGGTILHTVFGGDFSVADGNRLQPGTNRRVTFTWDGTNAITGLKMTSTGVAFEFDDFGASVVPEPATWAMLIAGFGMVGFAARRRRGTAAHATA